MYDKNIIDEMLTKLKNHKQDFNKQQYSTIKGQIKAGDITGATKGILRLLEKKRD